LTNGAYYVNCAPYKVNKKESFDQAQKYVKDWSDKAVKEYLI